MKQAFYFILGIALVVLTSATTISVMTVKPATPKYFIVKSFDMESYSENQQEEYIREMMKKGWILKSQSLAGTQYSTHGIVVMEKY
jgi:hypothetical protein